MITSIFFGFALAVFIAVGASVLMNFVSVGGPFTYREAFKEFKEADFEQTSLVSEENWRDNGGQVRTPDGKLIWFTEDGSFKIGSWTYVRNSFPFCLDPLHFYWWKRFNRYAENNLDHEYLDEDPVNDPLV